MSAKTKSLTRRIVNRIDTIWTETDYAQRRMLEIQTGVTGLTDRRGHGTQGDRKDLDTRH